MNNRRVDELIGAAMKVLDEDGCGVIQGGRIPSTYNGYIASFGPSVVNSDLLQTLAFYSRDEGEGKDRKKVTNFMLRVLEETRRLTDCAPGETLLRVVQKRTQSHGAAEKRRLKSLILEAAVACKLAMRTFPEKEMTKEE